MSASTNTDMNDVVHHSMAAECLELDFLLSPSAERFVNAVYSTINEGYSLTERCAQKLTRIWERTMSCEQSPLATQLYALHEDARMGGDGDGK